MLIGATLPQTTRWYLQKTMDAPHQLRTPRLLLRVPEDTDAEAIFARYASDEEVTRFVSWPRHRSLGDTRAFLSFSTEAWERWPCGPLLICKNPGGALLGTTGIHFETPYRASTGFVLARDAWGQGYASEALEALVILAPRLGVRRLYALCHAQHEAAARVLEKGGFTLEGTLRQHQGYPNLGLPQQQEQPSDVRCYARVF